MRRVTSRATLNVNDVTESNNPVKHRIKRKKRKKDLEQLRRNVLAAKRSLRRQCNQEYDLKHNKSSKSTLEKALNNFAEIREENENKTQGRRDEKIAKPKGRTICSRLLPEPDLGIFKNGAKGREIRKPKNLHHNETNEARLRDDVFKLLNGDETSTSSHEFNCEAMKKVGEKPREAKSNLPRQIEKNAKHNRSLFQDQSDEGVSNIIKLPQMEELQFSPRVTKIDDVTPKKWQTNVFANNNNNVQSIKRWGRSPAFHYEQLCAQIHAENFSFHQAHPNLSDPVMQIRKTLAAIYAEAHDHHLTSSSNDKIQPTRITKIAPVAPPYNNIVQNGNIRTISTKPISTDIPSHKSSAKNPPKTQLTIDYMSPTLKCSLWYAGKNISPFINDESKQNRGMVSKEEISNRALDLQDHSLDESPPVGWSAGEENEKNRVNPKNVKYIPAILRLNNSKREILINNNESRENKNNKTTCKSIFPLQMNVKKIQQNKNHENFNNYLPTPSVVMRTMDNETNKVHKLKLDYIGEKSQNYSRTHLTTHNVPVIKKKTQNYIRKNEKDTQIHTISIPNNGNNVCRNSWNTNSRDDLPKLCGETNYRNNLWTYDHHLLDDTVEGRPVLIQQPLQERVESDNSCTVPISPNISEIDYQDYRKIPSFSHRQPVPRNDSFLTDINSEVLANKYSVKKNESQIAVVPSMNERYNVNPQTNWQSSYFLHQMPTSDIPNISIVDKNRRINNSNQHGMEINDTVLRDFQDLSFDEDDFHQQDINQSINYMQKPMKYLAVASEEDHIPRRIPVCSTVESPINLIKSMPRRVTFVEHSPMYHKKHTRYIDKERSVESQDEFNFQSAQHTFFNEAIKNVNTRRDLPINNCVNSDEIELPSTSNVPINKLQNSRACEIVLPDGRIGIFVPKNHRTHRRIVNSNNNSNNNCYNQSNIPHTTMYQHNNYQMMPSDMLKAGPLF